jgi:hypothetical protein
MTETGTTTRTLRSYGPEHIYLDGLTKGPTAGWRWDGQTLSHPLGVQLHMAPAAAERITAAIAAYVPSKLERLTATQVGALPESERGEFELTADGWGEDEQDNEGVWWWVRSTDPIAGTCDFETAEVLDTSIRRS